jgi:hypothetical protein
LLTAAEEVAKTTSVKESPPTLLPLLLYFGFIEIEELVVVA